VLEDTIVLWENNRVQPTVKYYPRIVQFLEYIPIHFETDTLGEKITKYRSSKGLNQAELAKKLGVDKSTICHYEKNNTNPSRVLLRRLNKLLE
jgi:DNA-binding XRE family transcriptional regulator